MITEQTLNTVSLIWTAKVYFLSVFNLLVINGGFDLAQIQVGSWTGFTQSLIGIIITGIMIVLKIIINAMVEKGLRVKVFGREILTFIPKKQKDEKRIKEKE